MVIARFLKQCLQASKKRVPRFAHQYCKDMNQQEARNVRDARRSRCESQHSSVALAQVQSDLSTAFKQLLSGDGIPDPDARKYIKVRPIGLSWMLCGYMPIEIGSQVRENAKIFELW